MLKNLIRKFQNLTGDSGIIFNAARFNDPVALQTAWSPAKSGGASFGTHKLVAVSPDRLEFKAAIGAKIFYLIFLLVGIGLLIGFSIPILSTNNQVFALEMLIPVALGFVFAGVGGCMLYFGTAPVVFDRRKGFFWKGRTAPDEVVRRDRLKHFAEFTRIHAVQIISEYCTGNKTSYYSYELNLVLQNGDRINVIDHGNQSLLRKDAQKVAAFIEKPVWDAS